MVTSEQLYRNMYLSSEVDLLQTSFQASERCGNPISSKQTGYLNFTVGIVLSESNWV